MPGAHAAEQQQQQQQLPLPPLRLQAVQAPPVACIFLTTRETLHPLPQHRKLFALTLAVSPLPPSTRAALPPPPSSTQYLPMASQALPHLAIPTPSLAAPL